MLAPLPPFKESTSLVISFHIDHMVDESDDESLHSNSSSPSQQVSSSSNLDPRVYLALRQGHVEKRVELAHAGLSSRNTSSYYVTHPTSVVDYEDEYQQDNVHTNSEDPLASAMLASYDSAFISEVQSSSNNENEEQMYPTHTKIINSTIGDDQIDSDIIFDSPNGNVNSGSIEKDTHVPDLCAYYLRDINEEERCFESTESELCELEKQNDFLKDQLLEVSLKHEVELSVLLNHECVDNSLHAEIEQLKKKSIEIQEGLQTRIKILEKDVQRCEKQSVDFELKLQHEKEKHKWDLNLKNKNTNPLDYSWISKMEKLEDENVSLDFTVQSLIKERDNVKLEYQKLFNSIKKTRSQTQTEMDELIAHVSEKTYAYGAIRAENQNLLFTISELKTRLANVEKGINDASSVRRPMNRDSHVKNSVLANSKKPAKKVAVYVRKNKQTDNTSKNVISNKENVIDVDVANASKAKTLLCVSCMQNVLIPCHDNCFANYKLNVHSNDRRNLSTKSRTPKSYDTAYVVHKTRFSKKSTLSKYLDTTYVVSKPKIDVGSTSKANDKVVQIVLWIVDSGCSKHMTGDRSLLKNFIEKFMGTVRFGNDNFAAITGYGDYIQGNITICHVYYVEGLGHNLFSVGQFCDGDLEVAFRSKTCYVRNQKE
ncbi:hypothetical protein Tco_0209798 [Tanacetum coccineum]